MNKRYRVLAINPGSTSTKIGVYENERLLFEQVDRYTSEALAAFKGVIDQYDFRKQGILALLEKQGMALDSLDAVVGRGGLLKPLPSGTFGVNELMLADLRSEARGSHASNLGALLAGELAQRAGIPAFIVDPVVVDELAPVARLTGRPEIERRCVFHALNHKAAAKRLAKEKQCAYETVNLVVAHLGGGISVGCHKQGRIVEVNNCLDGEGPFAPERAGTVQAKQFVELVVRKGWDLEQVSAALAGHGGLVAHLGTNDARTVETMIAAGDEKARLVYDAMIYQVSRCIAAAAVAVQGRVDYVLLTGGIAYSKYLTDKITADVQFIAPVVVMPGEDELRALAEGAIRVLSGQEAARVYE